MIKRIFSLVLALVLTVAVTVPALCMTASASAPTGQRFTDVTPDAWYYEVVNAMADAGIVNGVGDSRFEPDRPMTAGELATVLWNMTYGATWYEATEMYNNFDNGCNTGMSVDYSKPDYPGPRIGNWGIPKDGTHLWGGAPYSRIVPTTWDGPVALAIYGDSRLDSSIANDNFPDLKVANAVAATQINLANGRAAGHPESPHDLPYGTLKHHLYENNFCFLIMAVDLYPVRRTFI